MPAHQISFRVEPGAQRTALEACVARAIREGLISQPEALDLQMDLAATHANGTPLDFGKLFQAPDDSFGHDVLGIRRHLDRETGKLGGHFLPRCALPERKNAVAR